MANATCDCNNIVKAHDIFGGFPSGPTSGMLSGMPWSWLTWHCRA